MIPLSLPDKRVGLTAAFIDRFAIGLVIGVASLLWPEWVLGLLSAPSAPFRYCWHLRS